MKKYKSLIKITVSIALLVYLYFSVDIALLVQSFKNFKLVYIPLIFLLLFLNYVISSIRWKSLLIFENTADVSLFYLVRLYFVGSFFNNFMPTSIGGDVYKIYALGKKIKNNAHAFSATFMERFTGVLALVLISVVATINQYGMIGFLAFVAFWVGLYLGIRVFYVFSSRISKLASIRASFDVYKNNKPSLVSAFFTSFLIQIISVLTQYFIIVALGLHVSIVYAFLVLPFITLASFVIPSLNGVGVQDSLYITLLGLSAEAALSASVMYHLFRLVISLIGGMFYAFEKE